MSKNIFKLSGITIAERKKLFKEVIKYENKSFSLDIIKFDNPKFRELSKITIDGKDHFKFWFNPIFDIEKNNIKDINLILFNDYDNPDISDYLSKTLKDKEYTSFINGVGPYRLVGYDFERCLPDNERFSCNRMFKFNTRDQKTNEKNVSGQTKYWWWFVSDIVLKKLQKKWGDSCKFNFM